MPRRQISESSDSPFWTKVERAYALWEQHGDIDTNPTLDEAAGIWQVLKAEGLLLKNGNHATRTIVRSWFLDRQTYSPYVDEIAVERALRWDRHVWDALTCRELSTVYDRVKGIPSPESSAHGDYAAWLTLPMATRTNVLKATQKRRERAEVAA